MSLTTARRNHPSSANEPLRIDCDECTGRDRGVCGDCVVSFICGREACDAVVIDAEEHRAIRLLQQAGLVPELRHRRRRS